MKTTQLRKETQENTNQKINEKYFTDFLSLWFDSWHLLYLSSVYLDYQLHLLFAFAATMLMVNKD